MTNPAAAAARAAWAGNVGTVISTIGRADEQQQALLNKKKDGEKQFWDPPKARVSEPPNARVPEPPNARTRDDYFPLDSDAKIYARDSIRTFADRRDFIYKRYPYPYYNRGSVRVCGGVYWNGRRVWRFIYSVGTFGGTIPDVWSNVTNSASTIVAISITGVLSQLQPVALRIENNEESLVDVENWITTFFQVLAFAFVVVFSINVLDSMGTRCMRQEHINNLDRFMNITRAYGSAVSIQRRYYMEYDYMQDPDIARIYFTMRAEKWAAEERNTKSFFALRRLWVSHWWKRWTACIDPLDQEWKELSLQNSV